jgi:hypothetical protein
MTDPARRRATYEDLLEAPPNKVAEIIGGELRVLPHPAKPHAAAASAVGEELGPPFKRGRGGPGGWILSTSPSCTSARTCWFPISRVGGARGYPC